MHGASAQAPRTRFASTHNAHSIASSYRRLAKTNLLLARLILGRQAVAA